VWAPRCEDVALVVDPQAGPSAAQHRLERDGDGYFAGFIPRIGAGTRYRLRLDGGDALPDPASRFQPEGPHGPSEIVDPARFSWGDRDWAGVRIEGQIFYELHVGTFTPAGTFRSAIERLPDLVDIGVTVLELMPIADFPGRFGGGYGGVNLFAPSRLYGTPDDLRALIDAAHRLELGVVLDVVYNHLGPDGNYLTRFADRYFSPQSTEWGAAINFDGDESDAVREFILMNAAYWIDEFHFDGLRLDATQQIFDRSAPHIIAEIAHRVRDAARGRATVILAENETQQADLARPQEPGRTEGAGLDGLWNDDFHHSMLVALTGRAEAYYTGYRGTAQELVSAAKYGFLFQGEWYAWQKTHRGTPAFDLPPHAFVHFIENHDQLANSARGDRLRALTSSAKLRAATALLLLSPQTPMLFQGQEFGSSAPFLYFADHTGELAEAARTGRARFLSQFASLAGPEAAAQLADPSDPLTFVRCKLDWSEREKNADEVALHRDLLRLRREDPVFHAQRRALDGAVLDEQAFALRFFGGEHGDRLLVVNLGSQLDRGDVIDPLVAPPRGMRWCTLWSSHDPAYGGGGAAPLELPEGGWRIPAESATVLTGLSHAPD